MHPIQLRSPRIVQNARNILIFWLIHPKIPQQQQLQNGEKWKSNLKRTMFRLMVKLIHPQRAADCTAANCHQKQRLFWDSPLPPFGFFLVCSHHPEQQQTRQPQPKEQYPLSHQPCRNCRFRAAGRNRTMVCTISSFGVKISRAVPYSSVVKSA